MNSYDKINYKLRTQKRIERALMVDLINLFNYKVSDNKLNYIGMGSLYFTDFIYFHKHCTINEMYSIEYMRDKYGNKDEKKEQRFRSNIPIDKIRLVPKLVSEAIDDDDLPLGETNFVWYDYDGNFVPAIVDDLEKTIDKMTQTSLLAVSFNSLVPFSFKERKNVVDTKKCVDSYKKYMIGSVIDESEFVVDKYADTAGKICEKYLQHIVDDINDCRGTDFKLLRVSRIIYQDGVQMYTYIWAFIDQKKFPDLESELAKLKIFGEIDLTMENLTLYEKIYLDKHCGELPEVLSDKLGIERTTVERYYKYAKYIPEFSEIVL